MWFVLEKTQHSYTLSERLLRAIQFKWDQSGEDVEQLIEQGAEVNQPHGILLPLHCACMANDVRSFKILLERGAQVNAYDGYHRTPLHHAVEKSPQCTLFLLENGADMELGDHNQNKPLHLAAFNNNVECVRILLEYGANVDTLDKYLDTPLSWAAMQGNLDSIEVLLDYNAKVDTINYNGYSPLQRIALVLATGVNSITENQCFQLIIRALGQFNTSSLFLDAVNDIRLEDRVVLHDIITQPRRLLDQCRFAIRRCLGRCYMPTVVATLQVPERLKDFLLLRR